jgi:hypothetical protein
VGAHVEEIDPADLEEAPPIADVPVVDEAAAREDDDEPEPPIVRAPEPDDAYASDDPVPARRYVYRVQLRFPGMLEEAPFASSAAELFVDVSEDRLRARFVGPGWPVEAGSVVRLRGHTPGVYLFERAGARSIGPGAMAAWYEGGPRMRTRPVLAVRREVPRPGRRGAPPRPVPPGALVCALLAEWTNELRENVIRRCQHGAPVGFRVGPWHADRTADVPVELPRRALRADEADPPARVVRTTSRAFLEPSALVHVEEMQRPPPHLPRQDEHRPPEGLEFVNEGNARVLVTVESVAIGWVDPHESGLFIGLRPGTYRVAALRPLGAVVIQPRIVVVPGRTILRAPDSSAEEGP